MSQDQLVPYNVALEDFREARRQAALERLAARLRGHSADLLSFEEVRRRLRAMNGQPKGLQEIPLDSIVGSVGRYTDFTRGFLPKEQVDPQRWTQVNLKATGLRGLPPIEVYKVGEAYFVKDGNHRVSVARRHGAETIQAYVTEVDTKVPVTPEDEPDDIIIKGEYVRFLERMPIDKVRPQANLLVTEPGKYELLEEYIRVHRYFLGLEKKREISIEQALASWYDNVYMPVVKVIRRRGLLRDFPGRTETDLYLWLVEHQEEIRRRLGWHVTTEEAANDLRTRFAHRLRYGLQRFGERLYDLLLPDPIESGPPPGRWRRAKGKEKRLFDAILVPVKGDDASWQAVRQALVFARHDGSLLRGLHIAPDERTTRLVRPQMLQSAFAQYCAEAGAQGELTIVSGNVSREVCARARWADLVVMKLNYVPGPRFWQRWRSGFRTLIRRCPLPVLAVPGQATSMEHALLAFDHTPRAREALYVAAYLAAKWGTRLTVVTVMNAKVKGNPQAEARAYLENLGLEASYIEKRGPVAASILKTAARQGCDLILIGSYNRPPLRELIRGSVLEDVLRGTKIPTLICR